MLNSDYVETINFIKKISSPGYKVTNKFEKHREDAYKSKYGYFFSVWCTMCWSLGSPQCLGLVLSAEEMANILT